MAVNLVVPDVAEILPVPGVRIGCAQAGIRKPGRYDLTVFSLAEGTTVAGVFTRNAYCAAPVQVCREHLAATSHIRALVVNTGNANAGTGGPGLAAAHQTCETLAAQLQLTAEQVLPFSTGVILEPLPIERLLAGLPACLANLSDKAWPLAARAIMTTDTLPKMASRQLRLGDSTITLTGISKGAGMIRPNMATMLGFIATDAGLTPPLLQTLIGEAAEHSFNRITIDGDTSTNDSFVIAATGASNIQLSRPDDPHYLALRASVIELAQHLAQLIVRDGEGATKFITVRVEAARTAAEARQVAYAIAHSPLVKTAFHASDANLGRILAAIGYAGVPDLAIASINLWLDSVHVVRAGERHPEYHDAAGQAVMQQTDITIRVSLGRGTASDTVYTCDLSQEYVRINADYRS